MKILKFRCLRVTCTVKRGKLVWKGTSWWHVKSHNLVHPRVMSRILTEHQTDIANIIDQAKGWHVYFHTEVEVVSGLEASVIANLVNRTWSDPSGSIQWLSYEEGVYND